jgi:hypothetical protein
MRHGTPIFANEATAAGLLDLKVSEFRALVASGHLPVASEIAPGLKRWSTYVLQRIGDGSAAEGMAGVEW